MLEPFMDMFVMTILLWIFNRQTMDYAKIILVALGISVLNFIIAWKFTGAIDVKMLLCGIAIADALIIQYFFLLSLPQALIAAVVLSGYKYGLIFLLLGPPEPLKTIQP